MAKAKSPTLLSDIGEFGLIQRLTKDVKLKNKSSIKGIGDDCAVIGNENICTVVTTDMLTEGIHFDLMYTPLKHLGYKSIMVNLSDVYAMNAIPKQVTVSISVSSKFSVEAIEELYEGIHLACDTYGVDLVGGDTVSSLTGLTISVTAIGEIKKENLKYRSAAENNDLICVSGDLGGAYLGLQLLEREKKIFEKDGIEPNLEGYDYIMERQLKPEARKDIIEWIAAEDIPVNAMIDISDGLSSELIHICKESGKGCQIYPEKIPLNPACIKAAEEFEIEALVAALHGGEDYELLFTVPLSEYDKIRNYEGISVIGSITDTGKALLVTSQEESVELVAQGWEGF